MAIEIRRIEEDELEELLRVDANAFGVAMPADAFEKARPGLEIDRSFAAVDGGRIVGSSSTFTMRLAMPGGEVIPIGGLSWVGVLPTHRRQGALRRLIDRHLQDCRDRGEVASGLGASEATIYGRFGYGIASLRARYEIDRYRAHFRRAVEVPGRFELLDRAAATEPLRQVFDLIHPTVPGEVSRTAGFWGVYFGDLDWEAEDDKPWFHLVHRDEDDSPDGFALYRVAEERWRDGLADHVVEVQEIQATTPELRLAIWRYLLDLDLVGTVRYVHAPVDDPVRWVLQDPRRLRTVGVADELWLRPLDVPALLAERRYERPGEVIVEVVDDLAGGRFHLEVREDGVACEPSTEDPDVALGPSELGSIVLGGVSLRDLHVAGRVDEQRPGAVDSTDALFRTRRQPFTATTF